ncbi:MAG: methylenetetrahydrofolate--tRNA-(uracil(54)-C(5))-methyltransferase (FADH(2)-oxidizing) TrmFO [Anaerolineae bacterium]|nr:methylenetetrahydrofolate--tRNA-(uracil(54)-C(5))-methyltransferase (FADH(2)-oxidizing) TrmFO [Anaerolineae bacterium]
MSGIEGLRVTVVGGGLAGSEAAWQLAERGLDVELYEMRPRRTTGAHVSDRLGELVCSNSFGSQLADRAPGMLKAELQMLGSLLIRIAHDTALPAGGALAVDREAFAAQVTGALESHPRIHIRREEVTEIPAGPALIATGPLTSETLAKAIATLAGQEYLYFYDAIAPIVTAESIDLSIAFRASRYGRGQEADGDYINCPMNREEYEAFVAALLDAETAELRDFEREDPRFFEGCLPIEQIAARGPESLAFGPMRPVGLRDPRTGKRPHAVVQLRRDNLAGSLYNLVGFQTNLKWGQQEQALRLIPGLANAEFVRMGQMHRNTFINSPTLLDATLQFRTRPDLLFAGQITGVEGYMGNVATGALAGINLARVMNGDNPLTLPPTTMLGALCHYITHAEPAHFQPMKSNFGILPELDNPPRDKRLRGLAYVGRGQRDLNELLIASGIVPIQPDAAPAPAS